jgi:hypothetical protein
VISEKQPATRIGCADRFEFDRFGFIATVIEPTGLVAQTEPPPLLT